MKITFTLNDFPYRAARKTLAVFRSLPLAGQKIATIRANGEPITIAELEEFARIEREELAHNKRQGF